MKRGLAPLALLVCALIGCAAPFWPAGPGACGDAQPCTPTLASPPCADAACSTSAPPLTLTPSQTCAGTACDAPTATPTLAPGTYRTQPGDTLAALASRFATDPAALRARNPGLSPTQTLPPGLMLNVPTENLPRADFTTYLLPDSEVVFSPAADDFDVRAFVLDRPGFLAGYSEVLEEGQPARPGWEIVQLYAHRYSISPRLLLALLEFQSHALSTPSVDDFTREHALRVGAPDLKPGLSHQLGFASNQLNWGYYDWRAGASRSLELADGALLTADPNLNAGSYAVARLLGRLYQRDSFPRAAGPEGLIATYLQLFGDPAGYAVEPLIPGGLTQPEMQLPFEPRKVWTFTSGPHRAYGRGTPLGALDFAPPVDKSGCVPTDEWAVAAHDGVVTYAADGVVELSLGDGWQVVYLHIATADRAPVGQAVRAGDRLGHPSCEGGAATATHLHLSRKYRGEWIPADGFAPLVLSGWTAHAGEQTFQGTLTQGDRAVEACPCSNAATEISLEP